MKIKDVAVCCVALLALAASGASADIIVKYAGSGFAAGPDHFAASTLEAHVTNPSGLVSNLSAGTLGQSSFNLGGSGNPSMFVRAIGAPAAYDSAAYVQFAVTPDSGWKMNLSSLSIICVSSGGYTSNIEFRSSIDNYTAVIATLTGITTQTASIDLSASTFQGLTAGTTFRMYFYDNYAGTDNTRVTRFDDVTLNGAVVEVPEPASLALMGLGGLTMLFRKKPVG